MLRQFRRKIIRHLKHIRDRMMGHNKNKHIFVACLPKSGSTYLTSVLREITGFSRGGLAESLTKNRSNDVRRDKIERYCRKNTVAKQHVLATKNNVELLKEFNYRPVVLTRNIFDAAVSLYDYIEREEYRSSGYIHRQYFQMSREDKLMYLIHVHLPWYFSFLVSWQDACDEIDLLWVTYEGLFSDRVGTLSKILQFYSIAADAKRIEDAVGKMQGQDTRLNVGISGRGGELPASHRQAILDLAGCWKVDGRIMEMVGIKV
ncbi:MAG: sulfotransferase domain-containing protein [Sedimentisphaerales bacterium]|nr:sulfotransferase domain-containing protein [Sedimentisphaerales bacterium]